MTASVLDSRRSWARLALTLAIATTGNAGMWTVIVALPSIQAEFGLDRGTSSLTYAATMLGFAAGNVLAGRLVDRHGIAPTLAVSVAAVGLGHVLVALAPSIWPIALAQLMIGLGTAASFGPLMADVSHWFLKRRGIAVSIAASGNYLSGVVWPLALTAGIDGWGWRPAYAATGIALALIVLPLTLTLRTPVPAEARARADAAARARAHATRLSPRALQGLLVLAGVACCVAMSMPQVHIVAYCIDLGFGPAVGAEMLSLMLLGGVASRLISGLLADRLGGMATLLIGSTLQMLALFLYLPFDGLVPLYIVSLIFGLSQGGIVPAYAVIVRDYMPAAEAGARVGLVMMATIVGMALGGWLSGVIYDMTGSYTLAFVHGIGWNLLNLVIAWTILLRGRPLRPAGFGPKAAAT
ncbi:MAG: MFS transporter [Gemmobacter sp.]|uniref:MFS transporter n=1 Tax=Gemmobacter sp. TaxID=1898957 RepID=UPI00391BFFAA